MDGIWLLIAEGERGRRTRLLMFGRGGEVGELPGACSKRAEEILVVRRDRKGAKRASRDQ
jgi:hypothetical protein